MAIIYEEKDYVNKLGANTRNYISWKWLFCWSL